MTEPRKRLNPKHRLFVRQYIRHRNASKAAVLAGYSEKTAGSIGNELLNKPEIEEAIEIGLARLAEKIDVDAERVIQEYAKIAFARPDDVIRWEDGKLVLTDIDDLDDDTLASIAEVTRTVSGEIRVKFHDKAKALEALARHLDLFAQDNTRRNINLTAEEAAKAQAMDDLLDRATPEQLHVLAGLFDAGLAEAEPETRPAAH
ncbi:MAG: terminase small subunit [Acidobacteria bacterium]|nr:terminase small subunit [Acidobacteriota bacterium]